MLNINQIPESEPAIDVGIILPEDQYKEILIELPAQFQVLITGSNGQKVQIKGGRSAKILLRHAEIVLIHEDESSVLGREIELTPKSILPFAPGQGIQVQGLIVGRAFHWKKTVDLTLPGAFHFRVLQNHLILINRLPFEQYLACVATSEMSAACPAALIEAQTIAARSWILANVEQKHRHLGMDVCNDDCCQRYQGSTFLTDQALAGVRVTLGQVLMYENQICDARYSKSCGGMMEAFSNVWPGETKPYLQIKPDAFEHKIAAGKQLDREDHAMQWLKSVPGTFCSPRVVPEKELKRYLGTVDESGQYFRWQFTVSQQEMTRILNSTLKLSAKQICALRPLKRGGSGRLIQLAVDFINQTGEQQEIILEGEYAIRAALHEKFLYSSAILVEVNPGDETGLPEGFTIYGGGWGHGVGLCQIGALGMALKGFQAKQILGHYYPGAEIVRIY